MKLRVVKVGRRKHCLEVKSHSLLYAYYLLFGKPWVPPFAVWTNCKILPVEESVVSEC